MAEQSTCLICLEDLLVGQTVVERYGHVFHARCLKLHQAATMIQVAIEQFEHIPN